MFLIGIEFEYQFAKTSGWNSIALVAFDTGNIQVKFIAIGIWFLASSVFREKSFVALLAASIIPGLTVYVLIFDAGAIFVNFVSLVAFKTGECSVINIFTLILFIVDADIIFVKVIPFRASYADRSIEFIAKRV